MVTSPLQLKYVPKLAGARVLVLGGTSGIGFAVASAALEHGATVIISGSQVHRLESALARLKQAYPDPSYHGRLSGYTCDLGVPEKLEENLSSLFKQSTTTAVQQQEQSPPSPLIDHIVFTAGDSPQITPVSDVTVDYIQKTGSVRFLGPLILAKLAPKYMTATSNSSITLTSGSQSLKPLPKWTVLVAYGCAVEGMARGLAVDLLPIRVNCVAPGAILTELFDSIPAERRQSVLEQMSKDTLIGQVGTPADVAEAYIYLMKDGFCTGSLVHSDGGRLLK
ncbi:hypothetical protein V8E54_000524 [Elaphomyces granulatus]